MATLLVVGASSGIGAACAKRIASKGNNVVLIARRQDRLEKIASEIGAQAYVCRCDLDELLNVKTIFDFCNQNGLKPDGMVYSAGINADVPMKVISPELFLRVMRVNCIAFAELCKYFFSKRYTNDNSRIVAISSSASMSHDKGMGPYSASKAALNSLVKTLSKELMRRGTLVNAILPAGVLTPMAAEKIATISGITIDVEKRVAEIDAGPVQINYTEAQPLGIITPGSLAEIVDYLVTERNRYMTGALIPVSAGLNF